MINSNVLEFIMEAHDGLSAKIVAESGFRGIWASGLSISTALGLRDANEASWTEVVDVLDRMQESVSIPIMLDGDTGFGNFNNVRRLVQRLCTIGVAAVCIEDKTFPKTNSFIGDRQPLASIAEFQGKIRAAKDSQLHDAFTVVARVEALIAGHGMDAALERAHAYCDAGADAVLIHSKKATADEVLQFAEQWQNRAPLVIVPTKYHATPTSRYRDASVSMVIWANHNLRAALQAMRSVTRRIQAAEAIADVEKDIASVDDVFSLMNYQELEVAESRYLAGEER
ncbi:phosphoenolpyruvate mutase [Bradyrhizobium jicamae]|nr:phosphoenolpyruvate mutase [Bradyrhizobium jicamae]